MTQVLMVVLAAGVSAVYYTIAAVVVPRIALGQASPRFVWMFRAGAVVFFTGCGLTHAHIALHSLDVEPVRHELAFHAAQFVGGWVFVFAAVRYLHIRVEPREREVQLRRIEELERLADRDPLTGAYNRRHFERTLLEATGAGAPVSVVMFDVDGFKAVNDRDGHPQGDRALRELATAVRRVSPAARSGLARLGGDEFALLLPAVEFEQAAEVAESARCAIAKRSWDAGIPITVSVGIACGPNDGESPLELMANADRAVYWAKALGRNTCVAAGDLPTFVRAR